jgi:AraC-like DNA-binding protein
MRYQEHPAGAALAPWVACAWERSDGGGPAVRVIPDGCIDIVWTEGDGAQVVGPNTTAFLVALPSGVHVVGVRMRPGAAAALLGIDARELRDGRMALAALWDDDGRRLEQRLEGGTDRVGILLAALGRSAWHGAAPDPLVTAAVQRLQDPRSRVGALASELAISTRQLRRRFDAAVGYGPKQLARVLRLERALASARAGEELARAAAAAGYADQAHFSHECRALAGATPSAL